MRGSVAPAPASSRQTRSAGSSLSRAASTEPAVPEPMMMKSEDWFGEPVTIVETYRPKPGDCFQLWSASLSSFATDQREGGSRHHGRQYRQGTRHHPLRRAGGRVSAG